MSEQPTAGPSRPPRLQPITSRSPTRSHSLSARNQGYVTAIHPDHFTPLSPTSPTSMRRVLSFDDTAEASRPPPLPPKDDMSPTDPLFRAARAKLSTIDQEAMRKLRSSMVDISGDEGSSRSHSNPTSPNNRTFSTGPPETRPRGSRRSTLSKLVTQDEEGRDSSTPASTERSSQRTEQYVIAVIGHSGVGKTTLLNRALQQWGVSAPSPATLSSGHTVTSYTSHIQPGGKITAPSDCHLVEFDISALHLESETEKLFPDGLPEINGAVLCYDATRKETLRSIPEAIHRLVAQGVPTVMFACKSDRGIAGQVEANHANSLGEPYNVGLIEVSENSSDGRSKMRNGMRWLIYKLELKSTRRRRRAHSESSATSVPGVQSSQSEETAQSLMWPGGVGTTTNTASSSKRASRESDMRSSSGSLNWVMQGPFAHRSSNSVSAPALESGSSTHAPGIQAQPEVTSKGKGKLAEAESPMFMTLESLLDELFAKIVSSDDEKFLYSFFMTFRRFCQPRDLMVQFLERYKEVEGYAVVKDLRHWAIQKMTGALIDWTSQYPGDLADSNTKKTFLEILDLLLKHTFMAHLTAQLAATAEQIDNVVDIDSSWALKPEADCTPVTADTQTGEPSSAQVGLRVASQLSLAYDSTDARSEVETPLTKGSAVSLQAESATNSNTAEMSRQQSGPDSRLTIGSEHSLSRQAMDGGSSKWSGAFHYVLTVEPRTFALELTRMQWQLFSAIRPRDVFRHDLGKERDGPIGKAIDFFNHLSRWISTVILADPKPKHRARVYERFMMIAHQLRRLDNYDSLYAVVSGMRETSIHRLAQTQALVQPALEVVKDFQSHCKLMDPQANYKHYQTALRSDVDNGRPAIPLLTPILSTINKLHSVRREDIRSDGAVQWDKFKRFGDTLATITDCQIRGSMVKGPPSTTFVTILNDTPVIHDEDGLFDRSRMLEPAGGGTQSNVLRRFGKLAF